MKNTPDQQTPTTEALDVNETRAAVEQMDSESQSQEGRPGADDTATAERVTIGLWIDHRKAVIVTLSPGGERTKTIISHVERQLGRQDGVRSTSRYESQLVPSDGSQNRKFAGRLNIFYASVINAIRRADAILLFGPGEATGELKKRLEREKHASRPISLETADKMSDRQIAAKVRNHPFPPTP